MQKITPFLWFKNSAEQAASFYQSVFDQKNGKNTMRDPNAPANQFEIAGQTFVALNGNPGFEFNEAVSFMIDCETQDEVDYYWNKLSEGGKEQRCGWLKDKFGVSWQVVPSILPKYLKDENRKKANNVMQAMLGMVKLDIEKLENAYNS
jgi:predicted 3-demethylubiquinone-9 3-methyltransferase (glyoxalase superfamily)